MKRLPVIAALMAAAVGAILILGGGGGDDPSPTTPTPAPDTEVTTSTTGRTSVLARWRVPTGTRATSVVDLERRHAVLRMAPSDPTVDGGAGIMGDTAAFDRVGTTVRFTASVQVLGGGSARLFLRAHSPSATRGEPSPDLAVAETPDDEAVQAGAWERLSLELVVPPGTTRLFFGVSLSGPGAVLVDDVVDP